MKKFKNMIAFSLLFSCCLFAQTDLKVKDASNNTLLKINDEGIAGSITLNSLTSIESPINKLYAMGTNLYWNGFQLGTVGNAGGWTDAGSNIYNSTLTDYIGIGTNTPNAKLHLKGDNFPSTFMILESDATKDAGFRILENGIVKWHIFNNGTSQNLNIRNAAYNPLLIINQTTGNIGIGTDNPLSKLSVGIDGHPLVLISAESFIADMTAIRGTANSFGGLFQANGISGVGVAGGAPGNNGIGVHGGSSGPNGIGIKGVASSTGDGVHYGGYFEADGNLAYGISSTVSGTNARGVSATANGSDAIAIIATAAGQNGYAGWFAGRVHVTTTLSKSAGSFMIDHPLDPSNMYLSHSFVESPDMMNIYNGNVVTDVNGLAIIELPEWFEALNKNFRYQLTVLGEFAQAIISEKIRNNKFTLKTDKPNIEVSWQVTGIRQDAYANANRIQVEELKADKDRGKYLHPEAFNMPSTAGVNYNEKMEQENAGR